ncbi:hypothetical protein BDV96DRAFT_88757 [Lophiotrema nucula]|uniref:Uncharacterized protein n=1 Tax=Lophiotrema nucula TaxID=690887 RepID=A0A6A5Z7C9_9PLEO|nr:hypothetical protein BDV96DRAFT_88757 [Lophiotrema nucula]
MQLYLELVARANPPACCKIDLASSPGMQALVTARCKLQSPEHGGSRLAHAHHSAPSLLLLPTFPSSFTVFVLACISSLVVCGLLYFADSTDTQACKCASCFDPGPSIRTTPDRGTQLADASLLSIFLPSNQDRAIPVYPLPLEHGLCSRFATIFSLGFLSMFIICIIGLCVSDGSVIPSLGLRTQESAKSIKTPVERMHWHWHESLRWTDT